MSSSSRTGSAETFAPSTPPASVQAGQTGFPAHGGRLIAARASFPSAPTPWIDLSTGISPFRYPYTAPAADVYERLPEPEQEHMLRAVAAARYAAPGPDNVCIAPGSQMLISLLPIPLACRRAAILSPTYSEHEASWRRAGTRITRVNTIDALAAETEPDTALVLCNPNNPDGNRTTEAQLRHLAERCASAGSWLIIDEAYADLDPTLFAAARMLGHNDRVIVLRSIGKSYGLAGLRLGFLLGTPDLVSRMAALMGPWPVSGSAIAIGTQALADEGWLVRARTWSRSNSSRLEKLLQEHGMQIAGSSALFVLAEIDDASSLWRALASSGLLARAFETEPRRLRFGLPACETAWTRLAAALGGRREGGV